MAKRGHDKVPVSAISRERLARWLADCERDNATPLVLVAVGHDEQEGTLHVYRPENGPGDGAIAALLHTVALELREAGADG